MNNNAITNIIRAGFAGWIIFELLNWAGILDFTLDFTWLGLVVTAVFVWAALEIVSARLKKTTNRTLPWIVFFACFFSISFDALGDVAGWYSRFVWYDQVGHTLGGAMAALLMFFVLWRLNQAGRIKIGKKLLGFMAITGSAFFGVLYELEEYLEDVFTGGNRLGSGVDTANDMMWNTIGALIVVLIAVKILRSRHSEEPAQEIRG
ncbi:hypothetical protein KKF61_06060 [Patescibacteria group bacterium]|nr:hypothetical protein [Patescibacteria group bacterium]